MVTRNVVGVVFLALSWTVVVVVSVTSPGPCGVEPEAIIDERRAQSDGSVVAEDGRRFPAGCFWESLTSDNSTLVRGCDSKVTCLWKCCPQGQVLDATNKCVASTNQTFVQRFNTSKFHILTGNPCLEDRFKLPDDEITNIKDNGMLLERTLVGGKESTYPVGEYCLDHVQNGTFFETVALVCYPKQAEGVKIPEEERRDDVTFLIYTIGRFIALPFLIATVAVYAVIPELRNLHGKCLVSHVTSLSVAYVFLIVTNLGSNGLAKWFCVFSALMVYFFLLGSFFWLNVMCFDIWWTFSGHRRVIGSKGSNEKKEFMYYSLYAWGAPVVMLCISLVVDFAPDIPDTYIRPEFGVHKCWFKDKVTVLAYFSGPVAFLIATNIAFFAVTAANILRIKKQTAVLSNPDSRRIDNRKNNEQRFVLYLKLFVVMGVTWSLDLIGWAIGGPDYFWWITDLANILQGVLIFIIFVWKARVRRLLRLRFDWLPSSSSQTASTEVMRSYT